MRTHIIGGTVAGLLVALVLWVLGLIWPGVGLVVSWAWHGLTGSISLPTWSVLAAVGYAVAVTALLRKRRTSAVNSPDEPVAFRPGGPRMAPKALDKLQAKVMRAMGEADGGTPTVEDVADDLNISQLRLEQTLEELEAIGYVEIIRQGVDNPVVDVTRAGRDYLIAKGLV